MSTEYRRGIPSTAHVEAATRLGLLWRAEGQEEIWRFVIQNDAILSVFGRTLSYVLATNPITIFPNERTYAYRSIRPDGTPVDWEVLDQEVARVGQQGQPQGFRADLWRRICRHFISADEDRVSSRHLSDVETVERRGCLFRDGDGWQWLEDEGPTRTDILARWTVYQELKPLYDIVDGAQGEAAMPEDVLTTWWDTSPRIGVLRRQANGLAIVCSNGISWSEHENGVGRYLRNFAAVLDAVAERRVTERMRGQTQAPTVTSAQPEPRRFADVRPDRHGWRWWRLFGSDCGALGTPIEANPVHGWRVKDDPDADWHLLGHYNSAVDGIRTIIPTDEQGNPVSWEMVGFAAEAVCGVQESAQRAANDATPARSVGDIEWTPRFTADELDDVDHSKTTKLDEVTLRRGKLPTVEQIAKYREVRARRTGGSVADALKESRIDCEVAQYVLERWAGGLGDELALWLLRAVGKYSRSDRQFTQRSVDELARCELTHEAGAIETAESSPIVQRERQEAEERRQRLAELRQRLAAERAAQPPEMAPTTTSRFDLIEPDPQADPAASIRAWEARQAARTATPAKPAAAPRRPAIEVVDAEVDGLSRSEVVTALFGRAFNGGC